MIVHLLAFSEGIGVGVRTVFAGLVHAYAPSTPFVFSPGFETNIAVLDDGSNCLRWISPRVRDLQRIAPRQAEIVRIALAGIGKAYAPLTVIDTSALFIQLITMFIEDASPATFGRSSNVFHSVDCRTRMRIVLHTG